MTFLTFQSADTFYGHAIHFARFDIVMEFLIYAVKLITSFIVVVKVNFGLTVAVDTPAHAQLRNLFYFIHRSYFTMAGLALNLTGPDMLAMVEVNMIR